MDASSVAMADSAADATCPVTTSSYAPGRWRRVRATDSLAVGAVVRADTALTSVAGVTSVASSSSGAEVPSARISTARAATCGDAITCPWLRTYRSASAITPISVLARPDDLGSFNSTRPSAAYSGDWSEAITSATAAASTVTPTICHFDLSNAAAQRLPLVLFHHPVPHDSTAALARGPCRSDAAIDARHHEPEGRWN